MRLSRNTLWLFILGTLVLLFFFVVKCLHFMRLDYTSDLFSHFQLSRDWMLGKPLFYENSFGFHSKFHNYFIDVLMGPFTYIFSVYGLFIVLFGLAILALFNVLKMLEVKNSSFQTKFLFTIFFVGPLTYFVFHNEHYGFHTEMLYVPLILLCICSLLRANNWFWLWAILTILVKEDGIVLLASAICLFYVAQWNQKAINGKQLLQKIGLNLFVCALIFISGLLWLRYMNNWGPTRDGVLFETFNEQATDNILASLQYLLSQRIQLTIFPVFIIYLYAGWRFTLFSILFSIPILLLNFLSGILYFLDGEFMVKNYFSLLWAPRLSMNWAYWLAALAIALTHRPKIIIHPKLFRTIACVGFAIVMYNFQISFFLNCYVTRFNIRENIAEVFKPNHEFEDFPEFTEAASIAKHLPYFYPVAPMYRVFGAFHKQDIVWLNGLENAYTKPRMIIASYNKAEVPDLKNVMKNPYYLNYKNRLFIYSEVEDTVYVSKAGLWGVWEEVKR